MPTVIQPGGGDFVYLTTVAEGTFRPADPPQEIRVSQGRVVSAADAEVGSRVGWHEVEVEQLFVDPQHTVPFTGTLRPAEARAVADDGTTYSVLYGLAVESGAPLTKLAFQRNLGGLGRYIVVFCVLLFAISTAISWSYYGDRCANYLFGSKAVLPYKFVYLVMHMVGAVAALDTIWTIGDIALGIVILPNLIALVWLSGKVKTMTDSYFERRPWVENAVAHQRWIDKQREAKPKRGGGES